MRFLLAASLASFAALAAPQSAHAHVHVVQSNPAEGSNIAAPRGLTLVFSDAVNPAQSGAAIVMTAMPGVENHGEMVIRNFTPSWSEDNRTLTLSLRQPLRTGSYDLRWQAMGSDGHRVTGTVRFTVK